MIRFLSGIRLGVFSAAVVFSWAAKVGGPGCATVWWPRMDTSVGRLIWRDDDALTLRFISPRGEKERPIPPQDTGVETGVVLTELQSLSSPDSIGDRCFCWLRVVAAAL